MTPRHALAFVTATAALWLLWQEASMLVAVVVWCGWKLCKRRPWGRW